MTWRASTRDEIAQYYRDEFPTHLQDLPEYVTPKGPTEYAVAFRERYPTTGAGERQFIRRQTWVTNSRTGTRVRSRFDGWSELINLFLDPANGDPLRDEAADSALADPSLVDQDRPRAQAVYYSMAHYDRSWLLPVDIDAKDVAFERASQDATHRDGESREEFLERVGIYDEAPRGFQYAFEDIRQALVYGFAVRDIFENVLNADQTQVYYSGQGCHVYLLDNDAAHRYDKESREVLVDVLEHEYDIPIDAVVTADDSRVMRLPYSLHADVSRVVMPIEDAQFDFRTKAQPAFLTAAQKVTE